MSDALLKMPVESEFAARAEPHRHELRVHCYRMLGSFEEAEDLVQETFLRAWRHRADLDRDAHLRAWLYRIATNASLDAIKARKRRVPAVESFRDVPWLQPYPDALLDVRAPGGEEPEAVAITRETIELTFLAVIQLLPAGQRAVLILREVLGWPARDVGDVQSISPSAVNSSLQRARATLREHLPEQGRESWSGDAADTDERDLLTAYMAAYESGDREATLALIRDDIRVTMPPAPYLFEGREAILGLVARAEGMGDWRLVPTRANRQPAAGCYLRAPGETTFRAYKLDVLRAVDGAIAEITTFGVKHFPAFGLPPVLR